MRSSEGAHAADLRGLVWHATLTFGFSDAYAADPSVCDLPVYFNWRSLLSYNYDQNGTNLVGRPSASLSQAFNGRTLNVFYDELIKEA